MRSRDGLARIEGIERAAWLSMAELSGLLAPTTRVEFASFLLLSALEAKEEGLEAGERAGSVAAVADALEVLAAEGW